jgi:hypothetical protein
VLFSPFGSGTTQSCKESISADVQFIDEQIHFWDFQFPLLCSVTYKCSSISCLFVLCRHSFRPWRWRKYLPPKHRWTSVRLHGTTSLNIPIPTSFLRVYSVSWDACLVLHLWNTQWPLPSMSLIYTNVSLIHLFPSIKQTQHFILKCRLQSHLKLISLKSHFLFICCNIFLPHKAIIRQPLIDRNHCTAWAHMSVYLHVVVFENVRPLFPPVLVLLWRSRCFFASSFPMSDVCPLYCVCNIEGNKWMSEILMQQDSEIQYYTNVCM